nr:lipid-binding SYLF domain-containing protein [uncultured Rhodopila sp.]
MTRSLLLPIAALAIGGFVCAGPVRAQSGAMNGESGQQLVDDAAQTVLRIMADSRYETVLKHAKGVFIVPEMVNGSFLVGGPGGQGVLLTHDGDGPWSDPVFLAIGAVSIDAPADARTGPLAMILMTGKAVSEFTRNTSFSLNGSAGLTIVNASAQGHAVGGRGDIIVWSDQPGGLAGVDISKAKIIQDTAEDFAYYHKEVNARQILDGHANNPQVKKLKAGLPG